jgi:hypothetical protein
MGNWTFDMPNIALTLCTVCASGMKEGYRLSLLGVAENMRDSSSLDLLLSASVLWLSENLVAPGRGSYRLGKAVLAPVSL